ncbi:flagellar export protein FliJ [Candidatus Latescibacterota bacterium]
MNRFRFRLENVLRYRGILEEEKKRVFGEAMRKLQHEEHKLNQLGTDLEDHEHLMTETSKGSISAHKLRNNYFYARSLDGKIRIQKKRIQDEEKVVDSKRSDLIESTKRKKIIERLKERHREVHKQAQEKEEQGIVDELTSVRFKWKR